ncbi:MAG TPA: CAP domain-containing protein [Chitinivibrionales bacterium]|nr:CAP domain-containing protein [Chitinivibrionales bacterium]
MNSILRLIFLHLAIIASFSLPFILVRCSTPSTHYTPATPTDTADPYAAVRQQCVDKINSLRATIGLGPLTYWSDKDSCSDTEARDDSQSGVAHGAFGRCGESAQNECPGYGSTGSIVGGCLQAMWDEGPGQPYSQHGHYINMTNTAYSKVSVGFYTTPSGSVWTVFNFYQ